MDNLLPEHYVTQRIDHDRKSIPDDKEADGQQISRS
jgi:hypothetical protein